MKIRQSILIAAIAAAAPFVSMAVVTPSMLFTDNMVIQRETHAPVWGTADAGEQVTVTASWGASASATAGQDGKWMLKLKTPEAGGPHTLTIQGDNTIEIANVLSGEVWFCSGQSNMDFTMQMISKPNSKRTAPEFEPLVDYIKKEIKTARDPELRQFTVEKRTSPLQPVDILEGKWIVSSPEHNRAFSATAYFFARELRQQLKVPVAVIKSAWGGTLVEPWMPSEAFNHAPEMAAYHRDKIAEIRPKVERWNSEQVERDYAAAMQEWQATKQGRKPKKPKDPSSNQQCPTTLFNAMVSPVIPYAIQGVIWYQGESNAKKNVPFYEGNFRAMITAWREQWGQGDFPFYFAQLANFKSPASQPVQSDGWASICDQQRRTLGLKNTGMAVLSDIGEAKDIHPRNKMEVGKRLALWALKHDYDQPVAVCSGPLYRSHRIEGNQVVLTFDSVGAGLMVGSKPPMGETVVTPGPLKHFQICGADGQWVWADAEITGTDTVTVSHPTVPAPTIVRYAWAQNAGSANLYNKAGLPASIFTTETHIPASMKR
jgi:sialate O-acetylesterase